MNKFSLMALMLLIPGLAQADVYVRGYNRSNGTYVAPHYQTAPDHSQMNNYSAQGNTNPYTGERGDQRIGVSPSYNHYQQNEGFGNHSASGWSYGQ